MAALVSKRDIWASGYEHPVDHIVEELLTCLDDPALAHMQFSEVFAVQQVRGWDRRCMSISILVHVSCISGMLQCEGESNDLQALCPVVFDARSIVCELEEMSYT